LFQCAAQDNHPERLHLHPTPIDNSRVGIATGHEAAHLEQDTQTKCLAFGTTLAFQDHVGVMAVQ